MKKKYSKLYNKYYFKNLSLVSYYAGKIVLNELYKLYKFTSVVDFGCGTGSWLKAANEIIKIKKELTGIDGEYSKTIHIFKDAKYIYKDLENKIFINKHDLAISLETAEHLSPERSKGFVKDLCSAADVVLFSAAVDGHGGTNHLNERTQSYWINLFKKNKYDPFIFINRKKYWFHKTFKKCPYYISGSFLFIKRRTKMYKKLIKYKVKKDTVVDIVHPYILTWRKDDNFGLKINLRRLLISLKRYLIRKLSLSSL